MKALLFIAILTLSISGCGSAPPKSAIDEAPHPPSRVVVVCKIKDLVGKTATQVKKLYGNPDNLGPKIVKSGPCKSKGCESYTYNGEAIEVVYVNDKADWITITPVENIDLDANAISALGLHSAAPSVESPGHVIRWANVDGLKEVSAFSDGHGGVSYFYVLAKTRL